MPVFFKGSEITPIIEDTTKLKKLIDKSITSLTAQDLAGLTSIGSAAFQYCSSLTSVTISDSVTSIGYGAFRDCSGLTSIEISNNVMSIGNYAFYDCRSLTSVTIKAMTPPTLSDVNAFSNTNNCPIYVPTPDTYRNSTQYTNWAAVVDGQGNSRIFPLVNTVADLSNIDTTTYTKACVVGNDEYTRYTYDGSQWNEVT